MLIDIRNLGKTYDMRNIKNEVLKNISLTINEGEMVAIMGRSGSGKSTLLNIIGCLDKLSSGKYYLMENNINDLSNKKIAQIRNEIFGFVVQHFALIDEFTVYQNVKLPLEYSKISYKKQKSLVNSVLEKLMILDKGNYIPLELSGGQNQRVAIARALVNNPKIILADEPTGALDSKTSKEVLNIFKQLNREGKTIIMVTHDENVASVCDRIIKIDDGEIVEEKVNYKEEAVSK